MEKNLCRSRKQNTQRWRERERERHKRRYVLCLKNNNNQIQQPTLTKGYKVTLDSDYFRATSLYTIYKNSPQMGCTKGQC